MKKNSILLCFFFFIGFSVSLIISCSDPEGDDTVTYTITYDGNGYTSGSVPIDNNLYEFGDTVIVELNTGNIALVDGLTTAYKLSKWNTKADGSGIEYPLGANFIMGHENITLYAVWAPYEKGDIGPGGGWIIMDYEVYTDGWRYLELSPNTSQGNHIIWSDDYFEIGTSSDYGEGDVNTEAITSHYGEGEYAAKYCFDLDIGGFDDWVLPAIDDIYNSYVMYIEPDNVDVSVFGINTVYIYWSSTENSDNPAEQAIVFKFEGGFQIYDTADKKDGSCHAARAVRYF